MDCSIKNGGETIGMPRAEIVIKNEAGRTSALCRLLSSSAHDFPLKQPIGSHDASHPKSEYAGGETGVESQVAVHQMEWESVH